MIILHLLHPGVYDTYITRNRVYIHPTPPYASIFSSSAYACSPCLLHKCNCLCLGPCRQFFWYRRARFYNLKFAGYSVTMSVFKWCTLTSSSIHWPLSYGLRAHIGISFFLAMLSPVQITNRCRALLIGCNYAGTSIELVGCINDVLDQFCFLTRFLNCKVSHTWAWSNARSPISHLILVMW